MSEEFNDDSSNEVEESVESEGAEYESDDSVSDETEVLEAQVEQAIENGASKKEVQNMIKKFNLKVNGKDVVKEIDLSDEQAVIRELQKAHAFQQTASESAELKKLMNDYISKLKNDPYAALEELGLDPDEIAEKRLEQRIQELKKSPEQIAKENADKELNRLRAELKKRDEEVESQQMQKLQAEIEQTLNQDIVKALDAHRDLPATDYTIKKIADTLLWAMDQEGYENVTVDDIMPIVKREVKKDIQKFIQSVPEEFLDEYVSSQITDKQRKRKMAQIKQVNNISNLKKNTIEAVKKEEPKKKMSIDDWMRR